ncbi:MAG: zinc-binding alcohol dehydrogenase family protein [Deltaproteobacteria bacterium]|nr:MAG: zinc-binding alcohol dehydrogenase family protein [Deltaproteobacteria bacterium]
MRAMQLDRIGEPLVLREVPEPRPGPEDLLIRVEACAVCRTDLHIRDGELVAPRLPLILGHEIVGKVVERGEGVEDPPVGMRVGVPWLAGTCGVCSFCRSGRENLCDRATFTGYHRDGGFAEYAVADARYTFPIPSGFSEIHAAPLLCAGLIGYRAYRMTQGRERLGLYGFGAAAHIIAQVALFEGRRLFAFTRPGDREGQGFARELGAEWAGGSDETPPESLDAAIIFAPVGDLVPRALAAVTKGGIVVCAGIHMSDIPAFPYRRLWEERILRSVANLTRHDGTEFFKVAPLVPVRTEVTTFPLEEANLALDRLAAGQIRGAAVLQISHSA